MVIARWIHGPVTTSAPAATEAAAPGAIFFTVASPFLVRGVIT
ncbi:hypothetical protein [Kitasatospora sp. NPDC058190]